MGGDRGNEKFSEENMTEAMSQRKGKRDEGIDEIDSY